MKTFVPFLFLVLLPAGVFTQVAPQKYFVEFTDKYNSIYSTTRPREFLSQRAIDRRQRQGIAVVENDIPVNQNYVTAISQMNVPILTRSKWFNGITIYCLNPATIDAIRNLTFVKNVSKSTSVNYVSVCNSANKEVPRKALHEVIEPTRVPGGWGRPVIKGYNYGPSFRQIHMLMGDSLHRMGYTGAGMVIAVLDAGFSRADTLAVFDSLYLNSQVLGTMDFVTPGNNVYHEYEHGMEVLSCMAANWPGVIIGTAPGASFWLLRTEDIGSENIIEEYNWDAAAEFADSTGADIINSSLGYATFDDPTVSHSCSDMNGYTTPVTRAANLAFSKGMIVVNSAGNSLGSGWKCVSAPADGFGVLAVAAVDSNGTRASFSLPGQASQRIKPNVAAMGQAVIIASSNGSFMHGSGTSFSSPILAGLVACLWQASPGWSNAEVIRAVELSSSHAAHPDSLLGYGIPDFVKALRIESVPVNSRISDAIKAIRCSPPDHGSRTSLFRKAYLILRTARSRRSAQASGPAEDLRRMTPSAT